MFKTAIVAAVGAAALALPAAASAQSWDDPGYARPYANGDYGAWRGDGDQDYRRFAGYPEFRGAEDHIRREIREAVRDDRIEADDAQALMGRLWRIRAQEAREFRVHGWNLPDDDRERLHAQLDRLDRVVDETRDER
jgi:hypothetical protein